MHPIRTAGLALVGLSLFLTAQCSQKGAPPARKSPPAARPMARPRPIPTPMRPTSIRPEPRVRRGTPQPEPPHPSPPVAIPSALDLPLPAGTTPLKLAKAKKLPYLNVPVAKVAEHARKSCTTLWYGVYLQGRKLGWGKMTCGVKTLDGAEVFFEEIELYARIKTFGGTDIMRMQGESRYATTGAGELLLFRLRSQSGKERQTITVKRQPDGWHTRRTYRSSTTRKKPETKVLKQVRTTLSNGERAYVAALASGTLPAGAKVRYLSFDDDELKDHDNALQVLAVGTRRLRGVPVRIHKVETLSLHDKVRGVGLHDARGDLLEGTFQGIMRIKREEKATAKRMGKTAVDFGLGLVIQAKLEDVEDPAKVKRMRLQLRGYLPEVMATHWRHELKRLGRDFAELTVTRESMSGLVAARLPVRDKALAEHLKATHNIEAGHPTIRAMAKRAARGARTTQTAARNITGYVFRTLRKSLTTNLDSALAIARARAGDCTEHARLMVALCRAIGLPAREVGGVTWVPDLGGFGYHAWVEVYVGRGTWLSADPAWNEFPANATHIWMGGPNDSRWMGTLGALKVKILDVKQDK